MSLIEIGCAPGKWMAYFHKSFGYSVAGIEYVDSAATATKQNMELQGIDAKVLSVDFFEAEIPPASYDVVFSGGFIEHFHDLDNTVGRISKLAKQYVVTLVPNLYGINGFISKKIRPTVFYAHKRIDATLLRSLHERSELCTLFCDYVGGLQFITVAAGLPFFDRNKTLAETIDLPFRAFNGISRILSKSLGLYPRTRLLATSVLYIGQRKSK